MTRLMINRTAHCDTERLYGPLGEAAEYLLEMKNKLPEGATLEEDWSGYADMMMVFSWASTETDKEMKTRLEREKWAREAAKRKEDEREQRARDLAEFHRLKRNLGL